MGLHDRLKTRDRKVAAASQHPMQRAIEALMSSQHSAWQCLGHTSGVVMQVLEGAGRWAKIADLQATVA
jgi:hypothetical protein